MISLMAKRVSARWRHLQAGMFEPPPAMKKAIFTWVVQTYAEHTLAEVELLIELGVERIEFGKVWNRLLNQKKEVPRLISTGRSFKFDTTVLGQKQTVTAEPQGDGSWAVAAEGSSARKDKPSNDEDAIEWVEYLIDNQMRALFRASNPGTGPKGRKKRPGLNIEVDVAQFQRLFVESIRIKKMLQPFAKKKPKRRSWARKKFPLDLTGWKYLAGLDKEEFWANLARSSFDRIQVTLTFKQKKGWDGLWQDMTYDLTLVAPSFPGIDVGKIKNALAGIKDTLEHELVHMAQTIIERGKRLKEEAGLPSKGLREEGIGPSGFIRDPKLRKERGRERDPHELHDVEFYTRLNDTVRRYERLAPKIPVAKRGEFFQQFIEKDHWLKALRRSAPRKYGKAVSELRKAVDPWLP